MEHLISRHRLRAVGVDPSSVLLEYGRRRNDLLSLVLAVGEDLPFADSVWDGIFVECSLSVANDADRVLGECSRVLTDIGRLILSDVYIRDSSVTAGGCGLLPDCRFAGILSREELTGTLNAHGFQVTFWEDQSRALKEFVAQLILSRGAAPQFWCPVDQGEGNGTGFSPTFEAIARARPGYFLCVARKATGARRAGLSAT